MIPFLEQQGLIGRLGGWLAEAMPLRGARIVCYHKNWVYFTTLFGIEVVDYVEPKPGIPPTARHVADLIERIEAEHIRVLLSANYFEEHKPELIAERTGITPVIGADVGRRRGGRRHLLRPRRHLDRDGCGRRSPPTPSR